MKSVNENDTKTEKMEVDTPADEEVKSEPSVVSQSAEVPKEEPPVPAATTESIKQVVTSQPAQEEPKVAQSSVESVEELAAVVESNKPASQSTPSEPLVSVNDVKPVAEPPKSEPQPKEKPIIEPPKIVAPTIQPAKIIEPLKIEAPACEPPSSVPTIKIDKVNDSEEKSDKPVTGKNNAISELTINKSIFVLITENNEPTVKASPENAVSSA